MWGNVFGSVKFVNYFKQQQNYETRSTHEDSCNKKSESKIIIN